jgi:hypothetical protein
LFIFHRSFDSGFISSVLLRVVPFGSSYTSIIRCS